MILLFDIIFQSGEFYGDTGFSWTEIIPEVAGNLIGGFIGTGSAIWLYYRNVKEDKIKANEIQSAFEKDKLRYLQHLIIRTLSTIDHLIGGLDSFIESVKKDNITFPELVSAPLHDLERIVHRINQEEYYHSYLNQIRNDDIAAMFGIVDYFYDSYNEIRKSLEKSQRFDFDRKQEYIKAVYEIRKMTASKLGELKRANDTSSNFYKELNSILINHIKEAEQSPTNLELIQQNLLRPILNLWSTNREISHRVEFDEIVTKVSDADKMLFPIKESNKNVASNLQYYSADFKKNLKILTEKNKPLQSFLENSV